MTNPSNPRAFASSFNTRSRRHDDIHKWLSKTANQIQLVSQFAHLVTDKEHDFSKIEILEYTAERLIFGYNKYFFGVVDTLISFKVNGNDTAYLLCEFKPALDNVGSILAQVKAYKEYLRYQERNYTHAMIISVILTYDSNTDYDEFLNTQELYVFRVPEDNNSSSLTAEQLRKLRKVELQDLAERKFLTLKDQLRLDELRKELGV